MPRTHTVANGQFSTTWSRPTNYLIVEKVIQRSDGGEVGIYRRAPYHGLDRCYVFAIHVKRRNQEGISSTQGLPRDDSYAIRFIC